MANQRHRRAGRATCALVAVASLFYTSSVLSFTDSLLDEVKKVAQPWQQPHQFRLSGSKVAVDVVSQGPEQWQVAVQEAGAGIGRPSAFATQSTGNNAAFGVDFDSTKSRYHPYGGPVKRVAFSAAGEQAAEKLDWTLQLEGINGRHFSLTGDADNVVYDAAYGMEFPVAKGLTGLYAVDAKRRSDADSLLPNWARQSAGLRHSSKVGDLKVSLHQPTTDSATNGLEYEAIFKGKLRGVGERASKVFSEDPNYQIRAASEGGDPASFAARVIAPSHKGVTFGLSMGAKDSKPEVSGMASWDGRKEVGNGIQVSGDTQILANKDEVKLLPVGLGVAADLAAMMPGEFATGSTVAVRGRYKIGGDGPAIGATAELKSKHPSNLKASAFGILGETGRKSAGLRVSANTPAGLDAHYEIVHDDADGLRQAAEVKLPSVRITDDAMTRGTARFYQGKEHGGKPRLQLGLQYDAAMGAKGHEITLGGQSAGYDSGRRLLDEMGRPWSSPQLAKARATATVLRKRIESDFGEGKNWLRK